MKQFDLLALHENNDKASMTSQDIADLVGSRHGDVKRSIERLSERNIIQRPPLAFIERINNLGITVKDEVYSFGGENGKRDSIVVVAQLRPELTAQIVDRWRELESGEALPYSYTQQSVINPDFVALARAVTESTASAMMKTILETSGIQAVVHINTAVSVESVAPQKHFTTEPTNTATEFLPVHKVSWETGLSDPSCRRLIQFANLPTRQLPGVRGLCVQREAFINAFQTMLEESTSPNGKHKRWQHPEFGGFVLRKVVPPADKDLMP
ncbi:transcriptional regulator [Mangrovibacter phragmitis]|uniref:transcriptional regulator n=1 Tax=Mangrovibacter phragmitis TaxID=1691903 RepID=UPI0038621308